MKEEAVKLLEERISAAVTRMRDLAQERQALAGEVERLSNELAAVSKRDGTRTQAAREAREALQHALAELREE